MTRAGLVIALVIGAVVGIVFAVYPEFDIALIRLMYEDINPGFGQNLAVHALRDGTRWLTYLVVAPAVIAVIVKFLAPRARMPVPGRAALFMIASLIIGPGIVSNALLKDHWGRYRPVAVTEFGGKNEFTPWWDPRGGCRGNCSFVAGEPSSTFWMLAPASLAPPLWQPVAYGAVIGLGTLNGIVRMAYGGHFFTDVVFAGVITFVIVWLTHGLIYRWRRTRLSDDAIERAIAWPMTQLYDAVGERWKRRPG
jgi:membrane-associated PAP2 superfamily phosphatase